VALQIHSKHQECCGYLRAGLGVANFVVLPPDSCFCVLLALLQTSNNFWQSRLWYFKHGLYYQGGMVRAANCLRSTHDLRRRPFMHGCGFEQRLRS
jgi:hypothetical protein